MSIKEKVTCYLEEFVTFGEPVKDDEHLFESGILDSTAAMELIMFLEETFDIKVEDSEVDPSNIESVNTIAEFVQRKQLPNEQKEVA